MAVPVISQWVQCSLLQGEGTGVTQTCNLLRHTALVALARMAGVGVHLEGLPHGQFFLIFVLPTYSVLILTVCIVTPYGRN